MNLDPKTKLENKASDRRTHRNMVLPLFLYRYPIIVPDILSRVDLLS